MDNLNALFDLINKKYDISDDKKVEAIECEKDEIEFLNKFINTAFSNDISQLCNFNTNDLFLAISCCAEERRSFFSFKELKSVVQKIDPYKFKFIEPLPLGSDSSKHRTALRESCNIFYTELQSFGKCIFKICSENEDIGLSNFINLFKSQKSEEKEKEDNDLIAKIKECNPNFNLDFFKKQLQKIAINDENLESFFDLLVIDGDGLVIYSMAFIGLINDSIIHSKCVGDNSYVTATNYESLKKLLSDVFGKRIFDVLSSRLNKLESNKKSNESNLKLLKVQKRRKEKIISEIQTQFANKKVQFTKDYLLLIEDDEISFSLLKAALEHNAASYLMVEKGLDIENAISDLEKLFKTYKFDFSKLSKEQEEKILENVDLASCNKMLQCFSEKGFSNIKEKLSIYDILMYSSPEIVSYVCRAFSANSICEDFVVKNPGIFISSSDDNKDYDGVALFDDFSKNIELLRKKKINTYSISEDDEQILLQNNENTKKIISLLNTYNLDLSNLTTFAILSEKELVHNVDLLIELGIGDYVMKNPNVICEDSSTLIKRAYICKMLGIPLIVDNQLNPKLKSRVFTIGNNIISNDNMDNYIDTSVLYTMNEDMLKELKATDITIPASADILKDFAISKSEYSFDGIIVSRQRFLRNYTTLKNSEQNFDENEIIINSIIYGSLLSIDDVNNINAKLCDKEIIKRKVDD